MNPISMQRPVTQAFYRAVCSSARNSAASSISSRAFSSLPTLRPTLQPQIPGVFRAAAATTATAWSSPLGRLAPTAAAAADAAHSALLDLVPKASISAHPALGGTQIRCGPRNTMQRPSRLVQKRRHGFLSRIRTANGRKTLKRRMAKGRKRLACL